VQGLAWNLRAVGEVVSHVKDRVIVGNVQDGPVGKYQPHQLFEYLAFDLAMEIVGREESAAQVRYYRSSFPCLGVIPHSPTRT
jgi:hypothetical protein